jgi:tRNA(Ile)-lysidine synthase
VRYTRVLTEVARTIEALGSPGRNEVVLCALSGGADSVALLDALAALGRRRGFVVRAAHLDHGLRAESGADAAFCVDLCCRLGVPLRRGRADVAARARREGGGLEDAGRRERYAFLRRVKEEEEASVIAVAHTRDDQAETVLLRMLRGSGAGGLSAMQPRSGDVIRPLLAVSREAVLEHLRRRGLPWREDESNADPRFLRNRVRHELLPYLEARFNPRVRETLARAASLLADEAETLRSLADASWPAVSRREGTRAVLAAGPLRSAPPAVARLLVRRALDEAGGLRGVSAAHVDKVLSLVRASASGHRLALPGGREAVVSFGEVLLGPRAKQGGPPFAFRLPVPGRVELPDGLCFVARTSRGPAVSQEREVVVAAPRTGEPLLVRTRRPGDRVLYRGRRISLKRFLMDRRVEAGSRPTLPLVAAGSDVLWVPGQPVEAGAGRRFIRLELREA